jgi:rRNA processing protein Krr1/Pno1
MAAEESQAMSKSAKKRANKKAREAEGVAEEPPAPEPKAAPKPKATPKQSAAPEKPPEPKAKGKAEAKAKPKAAPKEAPKEEPAPAPEAKAKPKADAKPKAASSKPAAKPKAKAAKVEEEEPVTKKEELINYVIDDGSGGGWETATGLSSKQQKQKNRQEEKKKLEEEMKKQGVGKASAVNVGQVIPGMMPPEAVAAQMKAGAKAGPKANQSVAVVGVSVAAAQDKGKEPEKAAVEKFTATCRIPDEKKIGWVVGPGGKTINMIKEKTGVPTIDIAGLVVTIIGDKQGVLDAEIAINQLIEKGYCSLAYDNYEEAGVMVHPQYFHQIIGEKGCIITAIKKEAKVEVNMPEAPKNSTSTKKYKITLAGSKDAVEKGKEIIEMIVKYGYHPMTHPDFTHAEMEVEEWKYKYLIGTKGSEMRHIQNSFKVKVSIPRPGSENQNVVIAGEAMGVERAVKHIEKVLYNADAPKGRGQADQAVDGWGEEEPEEDWMKAYMYKRK